MLYFLNFKKTFFETTLHTFHALKNAFSPQLNQELLLIQTWDTVLFKVNPTVSCASLVSWVMEMSFLCGRKDCVGNQWEAERAEQTNEKLLVEKKMTDMDRSKKKVG